MSWGVDTGLIHVATQSKPPRQQYPSEGNLQISEKDEQCENVAWGESGGCWNLDGNPLAANSLQCELNISRKHLL